MKLPENITEIQDTLFENLMKKKFGDVDCSQEFRNVLYEFYLTGARDSIEIIAKRIIDNEK